MRRIRGRGILPVATLLAGSMGFAAGVSADAPGSGSSRAFEFKYAVRSKELPKDAGRVRLWIPVPTSDTQQDISDLNIKSPILL